MTVHASPGDQTEEIGLRVDLFGILRVRQRVSGLFHVFLISCMAPLTVNAVTPMDGRTSERHTPLADSLSWLEDVRGHRALAWVAEQNKQTENALVDDPRYTSYVNAAQEAFANQASLAGSLVIYDGWVYQVLRNEDHPRGIWRRVTVDSFRNQKPDWQVLLDVDALAAREGRPWEFPGTNVFLGPDAKRCMLPLFDEGGYYNWREFDLVERRFVDNGFMLPRAKATQVVWKSRNELLVTSGSGANGQSQFGMPLTVSVWSRGKPLAAARRIFQGQPGRDASVFLTSLRDDRGGSHEFILTQDLQNREAYWVLGDDGQPQPASLPKAIFLRGIQNGQLLFSIREDWKAGEITWRAGSLLSVAISELTKRDPTIQLVMDPPGTRATISMVQTSRTAAYVYGTENISGRLWRLTFVRDRWVKSSVHIPDHGTLTPLILDPRSTSAFFVFENFLNPPTLYEVLPGSGDAQTLFKSQAQFAANNMLTEQFLVPSADGVPIPYFVVRHRASEASPSPTLIYAYGGHGSPALPYYQGVLGRLWLEKGGVFVLANVRGGGEFGPAWHVVGRQREHTYDDLTAVANDLVKRRITTPRKLAIKGHSAGGLLAAVMITQHPALFRAAILEAGYLDQFRPDLTLAGGEIYGAEFGSTESPEDRAFLERTSPYQNLRKVAGPPVPLIITSTSDTRISPAQSRRFAAKMASLRMPYLFFETQDGGHALAATPASQAKLDAMEYVFLAQQLMDDQ